MTRAWIGFLGFFLLFSGCFCQYISAPRSVSGFGSKRMLNSFSMTNVHAEVIITEYNEDLSSKVELFIPAPSENTKWFNVKACDQYYLAMSVPDSLAREAALWIYALPDKTTDLNEITIPFNLTRQLPLDTAVAPSGRNFALLNGTHLIMFEIAPQILNWTIIEKVPISNYPSNEGLAMSDSKISFLFNRTSQFIYNYKTKAIEVRDLPTNAWAIRKIDAYNDYWLYTSDKDVILEYPNGDLHVFNYSFPHANSESAYILPPKLSATKEYIDIAIVNTWDNNAVILGTLNTDTHQFEQYNTIPSKSLGLLDEGGARGPKNSFFRFGVSHSLLMYEVPDPNFGRRDEPVLALAVPSLPGNHSCSMHHNYRLGVFWCGGNLHGSPTNPCPSGTYQPSTGYTTCLLCPEGTYQPNEGSINCLPCKENEYCPMGTFHPENISQNYSSQVQWDFPITETAAPTFEEILLMLLFASSITNTSVSIALLGCIIITSALLLSLLAKHSCGVNLHQWLAKIDIHKKTKRKVTSLVKPNGMMKTETVKIESVFGGYLTLLAVFILSVGLITTIIYVSDYHPLLVGQDSTQTPSQNSLRTSSLQDYNTQSKASELANGIKDHLQLNITVMTYNFHMDASNLIDHVSIAKCFNQYGDKCKYSTASAQRPEVHGAILEMQTLGTTRFTEAELTITLSQDVYFTFATVEISTGFHENYNGSETFQPSKARYLLLPAKNKVLSGLLLVPITMTIVVRETQLDSEVFNRRAYMSFVSDEEKLRNMGHSAEEFALTNEPMTLQFSLQLDNNWRLESEQRRFSGVGAFFAALLAILGLYEVTLLASELAHRIFHSIEKRHKKRSKYQSLERIEDPPLIVNEKSE